MLPLVREFARKEIRRDALLKQKLRRRKEMLETRQENDVQRICTDAASNYQKTKDYESLKSILTECKKKDDAHVIPWLIEAEVALDRGQHKDARTAVAGAMKRSQDGSNEYLRAVKVDLMILHSQKNFDSAIDLYHESRGTEHRPICTLLMAEIYYELGMHEKENKDRRAANFLESIEFAKTTCKNAKMAKDKNVLGAAFAVWAKSASHDSPEEAFQAACRALELPIKNSKRVQQLRDKLKERLPALPKQDLLGI